MTTATPRRWNRRTIFASPRRRGCSRSRPRRWRPNTVPASTLSRRRASRLPRNPRLGAAGDVRHRHSDAAKDLSLCDVFAGHAARRLEICLDRAQPRRPIGFSCGIFVVGDGARRRRGSRLCVRHLSRAGRPRLKPGARRGPAVARRASRRGARGDLDHQCRQRRRRAPLRALRHGPLVRDRRDGARHLRDRAVDLASRFVAAASKLAKVSLAPPGRPSRAAFIRLPCARCLFSPMPGSAPGPPWAANPATRTANCRAASSTALSWRWCCSSGSR